MEEVRPAGLSAAIDIRLAADDFRNHGETADGRSDRVADAGCQQIAIEVVRR